jgi:Cu(I)/Ag(I) efflux system membrane fusion protein
MSKKNLIFIILAGGLVLSGACRKESGGEAGPAESADLHSAGLNPGALDIAGFKAERVERRVLSIPVKAAGTIAFNPRRLACLTARVPGRIEAVYAFEGDRVREGQTLLALYSLDYLSAQQELIQLVMQEERARKAGDEESASLTSGLIGSAVRKIKLMGVAEEEIRKARESKTLNDHLLIKAPFAGSLVAAGAVTGDYVEIGNELFQLADLDTVWATANIFEKDLALVRAGSKAEVRVQAYPGETFTGRLTVLGAIEDAETRTVRGRVELANTGGKLKPGMYADITLISPATADVLALPATAVRNVEGKYIVFVQEAADRFVPREVKTGRAFDSWVEILEGLREGEVVATEGSFSLKAEMLKKLLGEEHE